MRKTLSVLLGVALGLAVGFLPLADASRNSSGTYSLPSGPAIPGTVISSSWMNTTLGDLGTEVTNSLDRQGRGAMLAPLQLSNGTSGAPALTWLSEPASGLYRAGAGDVRLQMQTVQTQRWTASGVVFPVGVTTQAGLTATSTATSGVAASFTGGAPDGLALSAVGVGAGAGANITGGPTAGQALQVGTGTASTGASRRIAVALVGGDLNLSNVVDPARTTPMSKALTPKNLVNAWARVTVAAGVVTVHEGFNVTSVALAASGFSSDFLRVAFAWPFAGANSYACVGVGTAGALYPVNTSTTQADFWSTSATVLQTGTHELHLLCTGAQ